VIRCEVRGSQKRNKEVLEREKKGVIAKYRDRAGRNAVGQGRVFLVILWKGASREKKCRE